MHFELEEGRGNQGGAARLRSLELVCFLLFLLSCGCCLCAVSRQGGRVGSHGVPAKGSHTHTHIEGTVCGTHELCTAICAN